MKCKRFLLLEYLNRGELTTEGTDRHQTDIIRKTERRSRDRSIGKQKQFCTVLSPQQFWRTHTTSFQDSHIILTCLPQQAHKLLSFFSVNLFPNLYIY